MKHIQSNRKKSIHVRTVKARVVGYYLLILCEDLIRKGYLTLTLRSNYERNL